jgi:hypothetical protein
VNLAIAAWFAVAGSCNAADSFAAPPTVNVARGIETWWQWLEANPGVPDEVGLIDCSIGQVGNVWNLAGTNGQSELLGAVRTCSAPADKALFFPNVTIAVYYPGENIPVDVKRAEADFFISEKPDGVEGYEACGILTTVDGAPGTGVGVQTTRAQSRPFPLHGDDEAIADGYWSSVQLGKGRHEVRIQGGVCDALTDESIFEVDMTYVVYVR